MKLYLSSYRVPAPNELEALVGKPFSGCRTAIIPNAKDYHLPNVRAQKLDEMYTDLAGLGLQADFIDLRDYESPDRLQEALEPYDLIWVAGGNTFVLRSEMRRSGFDTIVTGLLAAGKVYGGESAGAIVAGPSLRGFEVADDPDQAVEMIWEGLGLTNKTVAPHMNNPNFVEYANHIKQIYAGDETVVYLNDDQALIIDGTTEKIVTTVV